MQTFDESKYPAVHAENESLKRCDIKCCKTNTTNYTCPICNRLRKVCPFSEQGKLPEQHLMDNTAFSRFTLNELTPIRKANIIAHNNTQLPANPLNMSLYPPMLNEIIYYPVIHNHYVSKGARNNPEMASSRRRGRSVIE